MKFQLSIKNVGKDYTFKQVFLNDKEKIVNRNYRLGTVHSVKGETFNATLLVIKDRCATNTKYSNLLFPKKQLKPKEMEELRIAYVGMTRPRKILVIAVPNEENKKAWETKLK